MSKCTNWTTAAGADGNHQPQGAAETSANRLTAAKLKQLNSKVQSELDAAVTAVPGTIAIDSSGGWFPSYTMQNTFTLNNNLCQNYYRTAGILSRFSITTVWLLQRFRFNRLPVPLARSSSSLKKLFSLNQFKPETVRLLRSDLKTVKWQVTISSVSLMTAVNCSC